MKFNRNVKPAESMGIGSYNNVFEIFSLRLDSLDMEYDFDNSFGDTIVSARRKEPIHPDPDESHKILKDLSRGINIDEDKYTLIMKKVGKDGNDLDSWFDDYTTKDILGKRVKFHEETYLIPIKLNNEN